MIQRLAQKLLGYHFTIIHQIEERMTDVDALTILFSSSYALHLRQVDRINKPQAYSYDYFK